MEKSRFEGWYFKHQIKDRTIAFIPGIAKCGAFIQVITDQDSRHFDIDRLRVENGSIYAGKCVFSKQNTLIDLPGIRGEIRYGDLTPLRSDIMGPFQLLPMECRHGVISMMHSLSGSLMMDREVISFDQGRGYIEKDSGTSFPNFYQWIHCNSFDEESSIMVSIANIPFLGLRFTGCIGAIIHKSIEYRLATYSGVKILESNANHISLKQGKYRLQVELFEPPKGHPLRSPVQGQMNGSVRESNNVKARFHFWKHDALLFDLTSNHASYEFVAEEKSC